jgi:hypothetical protein
MDRPATANRVFRVGLGVVDYRALDSVQTAKPVRIEHLLAADALDELSGNLVEPLVGARYPGCPCEALLAVFDVGGGQPVVGVHRRLVPAGNILLPQYGETSDR